MLDLRFVASIAERDIDLLVMEELSVNDEFCEWFSTKVFGEPIFKIKLGAWHSVSDSQLGESDLVFLFEAANGQRTAVLIENKITAPPQAQQGERYRFRGAKGIEEGHWEKYKTCAIAPNKYLSSSISSESYDVELSYEELVQYFQSRSEGNTRFGYKAQVLIEGIEQNRRGYQPIHDDRMTNFVLDYCVYATNNYPHLGVEKPKSRPAGSTWIMFYPKSIPKGVTLAHQLAAGKIKLFLDGQSENFDALQERYRPILPENAAIDPAGKSVAISIEVPKLDPLSMGFAEQQDGVMQALQNLSVLADLYLTAHDKT